MYIKYKRIQLVFFFINLIWVIRDLKLFKIEIENNKILDIRVYKFFKWTSSSLFFIGLLNEEKVFIKLYRYTDNNREYKIQLYLNQFKLEFVPNIYIMHNSDDKIRNKVVVTDMIDKIDDKIINSELNILKLNSLIEQSILILKEFSKYGIVHCDIRPENIIIDKDFQLHIIDFEFAICKEMNIYRNFNSINIKYLENLGAEYRADYLFWDDAYSFCLIIEEIIFHNKYTELELDIISNNKTELKKLVNTNVYKY